MLSLLRKKNLLKKYYFKINIEKNIPHGSGLGGGSSNAAHLLSYINIKKKLKLVLLLVSQQTLFIINFLSILYVKKVII